MLAAGVFPAFKLRGGECGDSWFPAKEAWVDAERIVACLTGMEPVAGLELHTKVLFAKPASSPSGWRRWFHDPTPFEWLKENTTLSEDAIRSFLLNHAMDRSIPLSRYTGTPKMLLGLEAAYARKPKVVVFSTAGLDPTGIDDLFRIVSERLPECAAICLAWPVICQGQEHLGASFPGSALVTIFDEHQAMLAS